VAFGPTTLESYATCPFRYFSSHLLGLEVLDEPDRRLSIDPRERGSMVHEILEAFVRALIDAEELSEEAERELLISTAAPVFDRYERFGKTGKRVLWQLERRRLLALLESERRSDRLRRKTLARRPIAVEHVFGSGAVDAVSWAIAPYKLAFRGVIDRIDVGPDGSLFVTDYKTGRSDSYGALSSDPVDRGRHLQLPVYALAAQAAFALPDDAQISAAYRFLDHDGDELSLTLDAKTTQRFDEVLTTLVSNIDAGIFPYHPGAPDRSSYVNCRFCDFERLCPTDRAARWELNCQTPELKAYAALADPPEESEQTAQQLAFARTKEAP
jgi:ATP-dependent helicase/DNAse subunit B